MTPRRGVHARGRSVALVGASPGRAVRAADGRGGDPEPVRPRVHLVNPRYAEIDGRRCLPSLADCPSPVDLVLLGRARRASSRRSSTLAAARGDRSARRSSATPTSRRPRRTRPRCGDRLAAIARDAGMALCGARLHGLRQRQPRPARDRLHRARAPARRAGGAGHPLRLGVLRAAAQPAAGCASRWPSPPARSSSPPPPAYLEYALGLPETRVLALVLEAMRDAGRLPPCWPRAADAGHPRRAADRRRVGQRPGHGGRALRRAGRGRRRLGGAGPAPTACTASPTWPSWPTPWSCSPSAAGSRPRWSGPAARQPGSRRGRPGHRHRARLRPRARAHRGRRRAARRAVRRDQPGHHRAAGRAARPRPAADQPAGRLGHRRRHPRAVRRLR